jgi:hypothetical protein
MSTADATRAGHGRTRWRPGMRWSRSMDVMCSVMSRPLVQRMDARMSRERRERGVML